MAESKRFLVTMDENSMEALDYVKDKASLESLAAGVRESVRTRKTLQHLAEEGFKQIVVRNPETGAEKEIVIPGLSIR